MQDIRIVEEEHIRPVLFGDPIVSTVYRLVDWNTEESLSEKRFETLAKAEQAIQNILIPYWNRVLQGLVGTMPV